VYAFSEVLYFKTFMYDLEEYEQTVGLIIIFREIGFEVFHKWNGQKINFFLIRIKIDPYFSECLTSAQLFIMSCNLFTPSAAFRYFCLEGYQNLILSCCFGLNTFSILDKLKHKQFHHYYNNFIK